MRPRFVFCLFLLAAAVAPANAQNDAWLQVTTPHFVVISNASEKDAHRVAKQFEQVRSVLGRALPDTNLDSAVPIVVFALQDKKNFEALEPAVYLSKGQINLAGLFLHMPERDMVLTLLNASGQNPNAAIYHEYTHFAFSRTGKWIPLWLSEGWAQFYQTVEILDTEAVLGKLNAASWDLLQNNALLPLPTLLAVDTHSPYYHEEDKGSIFYAESWALTHYLKMKDERDGTHHLQEYLDLVQQKADAVAAAEQVFGDLQQLQTELRKYIANSDFTLLHVPGTTDVDDSSFTTEALTKNQADAVRGTFMAYDGRTAGARAVAESILHDDAENASAFEIIGLIAILQGNFDESRKQFQHALKTDSQNFIAHYYFAASALKKGLPDAATQAKAEESLHTAIRLNPNFALAYYGLGVLAAARGKDYNEALRWMRKAIELDPGNIEIRIDTAGVLERMNRNSEALQMLEFALKMAHTPEQTAAVENVMQTMRKLTTEQAKAARANTGVKIVGTGAGAGEIIPPRAIHQDQPDYSEQARAARLEGVCTVSFIVGIDGKPYNISVTKKLGMGLDEKAIEAARKWTFEPARRSGKPVPIHLNVNINFKLIGTDRILELSEKARAGDAAAEFELANNFLEGHDIPKDEAKGAALLERAARDGFAKAQLQMGDRAYGNGADPSTYVEAFVWYSLAQRSGIEQGQAKVEQLTAEMTPAQLEEAQKQLEKFSGAANK